jgi:hypothetical protein
MLGAFGFYARYVDRFFRALLLRAVTVHAACPLRWKLLFKSVSFLLRF